MRITQAELRDILTYDRSTGEFCWNHSGPTHSAGQVAGKIYANGYRYIAVQGIYYPASLLAWIYVVGMDPGGLIDHKNQNKEDDRFCNLRPASHSENHANRGVPRHNSSGFKGVFWDSRRNKWQARLTLDGKQVFLGRYERIEDAVEAYKRGAQKVWGEFACVPSEEEVKEILGSGSSDFSAEDLDL
jgi:hypothetical protein